VSAARLGAVGAGVQVTLTSNNAFFEKSCLQTDRHTDRQTDRQRTDNAVTLCVLDDTLLSSSVWCTCDLTVLLAASTFTRVLC